MAHVFIGLGSNLGDRLLNLENAAKILLLNQEIKLLKKSSVEETSPVDYLDQPDFLNQVIFVETGIHPYKLLRILKKIEKQLGRKRTIPKGPRIIDLDILLYDKIIFNTKRLAIPHPQIIKRGFVLKHLLEIDPRLSDPKTGMPYRKIYDRLIEKKGPS